MTPLFEHRARRGALSCAALALIIATMALIGWALDAEALRRVLHHGPLMQPLTAIAVGMLGIAMLLRSSAEPAPRTQLASRIAGGIVAVGVLAVAAEYTFGWDISFDEWRFEPVLRHLFPGRVSPITAAALFFLSIEIVIGERGRFQRLASACALTAGLIATVALLGHLYGTRLVYAVQPRPVIAVALNTSLSLLLLAASQQLCRPDRPPLRTLCSERIGAYAARRLVVTVLALPFLVGILVRLARIIGVTDGPLVLAIVATSSLPMGLVLISQHARALDALEAKRQLSEERFGAFFQQSSDAIIIASRSGHTTEASDSALELLGRDVLGRPVTDFVAPRQRARLLATLRSLAAGATVRGEWTVLTTCGEPLPVEVNARMLSSGDWLIAARDVRDRKAAERNLERAREAERRGREQIEAISSAIDAVSRALAAVGETGLNAVLRTIEQRAERLTHAAHATIRLADEGISDHGAVDALTVPIRHRGATIGQLCVTGEGHAPPFTDDDRRLAELLAERVGPAIETARLYELEARARLRLQEVIDQMPDAVIISDAHGRVRSANREALAIVRREDDAIFEAVDPDGTPLHWQDLPLARALQRREVTTNRELAVRRLDGQLMPVLASATPIRGEPGDVYGAVIVLHDITRQKQHERMREQWTSIIAHDLRQPVAVISVAAQVLGRRGALSPEAGATVQRILDGCTKLDRMVTDLLDASRIEAQRMTIEPSVVDAATLFREIFDRASAVLKGTPARLEVREPIPRVWADPGRVEQVLFNLLSNAAKYGDAHNEIVVRVEARDHEVAVSVENSGRGIAPDELARLFSRFERTRSARSTREGAGLGLFITKGLVEAHGGTIAVESTPNEKTTFRFTLPAISATDRRSRSSRPSLAPRHSRSSFAPV